MRQLIKFKQFIDEIKQSNSRLYKTSILEKYKDDEDIKYLLEFTFNPYKITGLSKKKMSSIVQLPENSMFNSLSELIEYIQVNNTGTNETIGHVRKFIQSLDDWDLMELSAQLITKNLILGVDTKTINKVFGKLIPTFDVQLAEKYYDKPQVLEGKEFSITTKIDGGRIIAIKKDGKVSCFTRAGQEYDELNDITDELESLDYDNFALDGEITLLDAKDLLSADQYKQTMMITRKDGEKKGVKILAFDLLSLEEFENQECKTKYVDRRKNLETHFSNMSFVKILPVLYSGFDVSQIDKILDEQLLRGEEGIMINMNKSFYQFKRCNDLLKVKKMKDIDLEIVGFEEGNNKNIGKLGAFIVSYKDNTVRVGTGITDELRQEVWDNQEKYLGKTIEIKYFEESSNKQGGVSLRFPVFKDFRFDK